MLKTFHTDNWKHTANSSPLNNTLLVNSEHNALSERTLRSELILNVYNEELFASPNPMRYTTPC
jgi:hypothetical protein